MSLGYRGYARKYSEDDKHVMEVDGKRFIFEKPLGADFALIYGFSISEILWKTGN